MRRQAQFPCKCQIEPAQCGMTRTNLPSQLRRSPSSKHPTITNATYRKLLPTVSRMAVVITHKPPMSRPAFVEWEPRAASPVRTVAGVDHLEQKRSYGPHAGTQLGEEDRERAQT